VTCRCESVVGRDGNLSQLMWFQGSLEFLDLCWSQDVIKEHLGKDIVCG
jgi:hypothetical protein